MNKDQLKKNVGYLVRLRPIPLRSIPRGLSPQVDDDWLIQSVEDAGVKVKNSRTDHMPVLPYDYIREFMSDPARNRGGTKYGFLRLKVQLTLTDRDAS